MHPVLRVIIGVIAGCLAAFLVIALIEIISYLIYPIPEGTDLNDPDALATHIQNMSAGAFIWILIAYAAGSLSGGYVGQVIGKDRGLINAVIIGLLLTLAGVMNLTAVTHPMWFVVVSTLIYIPFCLMGRKIGLRRR